MFTWLGIKLGEKHDWKVFNEYLNNPCDEYFEKTVRSSGLFFGFTLGFLVDVFVIVNIFIQIKLAGLL